MNINLAPATNDKENPVEASSENRPTRLGQLQFKVRPDLHFTRRDSVLGEEWIVKDPLSLEYFLLQANEMRVLRALQLPQTVPQLHHQLNKQSGVPLSITELSAFLQRLCADNLAITNDGRNGARLNRQAAIATKQRVFATWSGILAIKLPGFSPHVLLSQLRWLSLLLFSPLTLALFVLALLATLGWAGLALSSILDRVPSISGFLTSHNILALFAGYLIVKTCHELGHGLACQYYGGRVREMGILLLFFSPCLYCDASDAWTISSRVRRMMISLAGVYVEMLFSLGFFWAWWFNANPDIATWLFGMMLTTSASTLFVNGNPLLKFDGYFALADWWEIPNLSSVSQRHLGQWMRHYFYHQPDSVAATWQFKTVCYAILATGYRWMVTLSILTAAYWILRSQGLEILGFVASIFLTASVMGGTMLKTIGKWTALIRTSGKRWQSWFLMLMLVGLTAAWFWGYPLERRVRGTVVIGLNEPEYLYAGRRGYLWPKQNVGTLLQAGDIVGLIDDYEHLKKRTELKQEQQLARKRIEGLRLMPTTAGQSSGEIEILEKRLQRIDGELLEMERETTAGLILAGRSGVLFPPLLTRTESSKDSSQVVYDFSQSKLEPNSVHRFVEKGECVAVIGDPTQLIAIMEVSPFEQQSIQAGHTAKILLPGSGEVVLGKVLKTDPPPVVTNAKHTRSFDQPKGFRVIISLPGIRSEIAKPGMAFAGLVETEQTTPAEWLKLEVRRWLIRLF
jgi:putative peptide zinc metalloprotease protein